MTGREQLPAQVRRALDMFATLSNVEQRAQLRLWEEMAPDARSQTLQYWNARRRVLLAEEQATACLNNSDHDDQGRPSGRPFRCS